MSEQAPEPAPAPDPPADPMVEAARRRRLVLGTLFGIAVVAVVLVTFVLARTKPPNASATAAEPSPTPSAGAPVSVSSLGPPISVSASASVRASVPASPSSSTSAKPDGRSTAGHPVDSGSFPDASNTGTPPGVSLRTCPGKITKPGTYDRCHFTGGVEVEASNVHITRSLINGQVDAGDGSQQHGLVISDSTLDCGCLADDTHAPAAVSDSDYTLLRVNIFNSGHGIVVHDNVTVQDSYIHGQGANTDAHKDGVYVGDGSNVVLRHNNIECNDGSREGCTAAIGLLSDFGNISNWVIDNNLLNTNGAYCFYGGGGSSKSYSSNHITFINNHFGRAYHSQCGAYGPVTYFDTNGTDNVWRNNVWADSGEQVAASNGPDEQEELTGGGRRRQPDNRSGHLCSCARRCGPGSCAGLTTASATA